MAILIKGMEMPKTCNDCPLHELFFAFGKQNIVCSPTGHALGGIDEKHLKESRNAGYCPLIEVPEPHGRLIDADALAEDLKRQCEEVFKIDVVSPDDFWITRDQAYNERLWKTWCESFYKYLESRPTVIPASEEG